MANQGCINEGPDNRFLGFIICPLQRWFSFKSEEEPKWWKVWRKPLPNPDPNWFQSYVTFGISFPKWYAVYIIKQSQAKNGTFNVAYFGWRYDFNWRGYIFPALSWQRKQTSPLHRGF